MILDESLWLTKGLVLPFSLLQMEDWLLPVPLQERSGEICLYQYRCREGNEWTNRIVISGLDATLALSTNPDGAISFAMFAQGSSSPSLSLWLTVFFRRHLYLIQWRKMKKWLKDVGADVDDCYRWCFVIMEVVVVSLFSMSINLVCSIGWQWNKELLLLLHDALNSTRKESWKDCAVMPGQVNRISSLCSYTFIGSHASLRTGCRYIFQMI